MQKHLANYSSLVSLGIFFQKGLSLLKILPMDFIQRAHFHSSMSS